MLDIYKASAGSGKTYTLALIYIDLIIDDFSKYSHILAVTFTNKSTAEMKSRIVENLYSISEPSHEKHNELLEAQKKYRAEHNKPFVNDFEIIRACRNALVLLLNNYSQFNISTIDKFVQRIIRSFAFENKLSADYRVNIDADQTRAEMVDLLMANMETDKDLQSWLTRLMNEKMDDGQGWDIESLLSPIAKSLLQGHDLQPVDRKTLEDSRKANRKTVDNLIVPIADGLERFLNEINRLALSDSSYFHHGTQHSAYKLSDKLRNCNSILDLLKDRSEYNIVIDLIKKAPYYGKEQRILKDKKADESGLQSILANLISVCEINNRAIQTIWLLDSKFFALGIINDLKQNLSNIEHEQHMQMIGGANKLLKDLIGSAPIPFIYEKAGSKFDNIMIDEFQDTSKIQWDNFRPLIENSLANDRSCLLVGDVKQAIYRWRNSDWKLLSETVYNDNSINGYISDNTLDTNWRSFQNIVEFNNDLFPVLARRCVSFIMQKLDNDPVSKRTLDGIADIYANGQQAVPPKKRDNRGYVRMSIMDDSDAAIEYKKQQLTETIETLVSQGYKYSDICIIIRNNSEATEIVQLLNSHNINVLSNQALYICEAPSIKVLISILKLIVDDSNEPALAHVIAAIDSTPIESLYDSWRNDRKDEIARQVSLLKGLGLLDLVYKAIDMLPEKMRTRDYIFLEAFIEKTRAYADCQTASLNSFIEYIESHSQNGNFVIQAPEGQNAVNITTIHKSKGLEYPIVFIPSANWSIFKNNSSIWCDVENDPYTPLNMIELPFSNLKETNYSDQYYNEATQGIVDNMNLLYVAFTRAREGLFVWCNNPEVKKGDKALSSITICDLIKESFDVEVAIEPYSGKENGTEQILARSIMLSTETSTKEWVFNADEDEEPVTFSVKEYTRGSLSSLQGKPDNNLTTEDNEQLPAISFGGDITARINHTRDINEDPDSEESKTDIGTAKHNIMQSVMVADDLNKSIRRAVLNGDISEKDANDLSDWFNIGLKNDVINSWFDPSNRVITESIILTPDNGGKEYRPDRVLMTGSGEVMVVDYKFANASPKHLKQVYNYMKLIEVALSKPVKGFLWYGSKSEPTPVIF